MQTEPLKYLYEKHSFNLKQIKEIVIGKSYVAVMLTNGNIGLSANLYDLKIIEKEHISKLDFSNFTHRNLLNAYFNAVFNNQKQEFLFSDIFKVIDFAKYSNIVMIGFSEPMYNKLKTINTTPFVFDYSSDNEIIIDQKKQKEYLLKADCVLLSSTSVLNNTFFEITENTKQRCDIFLFGPSSFMNPELFKYKNVKGLFGTVFKTGDNEILNLVKKGQGNRYLKKKGTKVALIN